MLTTCILLASQGLSMAAPLPRVPSPIPGYFFKTWASLPLGGLPEPHLGWTILLCVPYSHTSHCPRVWLSASPTALGGTWGWAGTATCMLAHRADVCYKVLRDLGSTFVLGAIIKSSAPGGGLREVVSNTPRTHFGRVANLKLGERWKQLLWWTWAFSWARNRTEW